jgi:HEAT repeat protein
MLRTVPFLAALVIPVLLLCPAGAQKPDFDIRTTEVGGKLFDQWMKDLQDSDPGVVEFGVRAIGNFGKEGRRAVPQLISILTRPGQDTSLKVNSCITLGSVGLDDKDLIAGVNALINFGLQSDQGICRFQAALALARIGPKARGAINHLSQYTIRDRTSWEIRKAGAYALGQIGAGEKDQPADPRAINALLERLDTDRCGQVRLEGILGLSTLAPTLLVTDVPRIVSKAVAAVNDRDKAVAIYARLLMAQLDPKYISEANFRVIASYLQNPDMQVRLHACRVLQMLGEKAKFTIPDLIAALKDKETLVATGAISALVAMKDAVGDREYIRIAELLKAPETYIRCHAAQALATFGDKAKARVPELISALQDREPVVLVAVAVALAEMGEAARPAIPSLQGLSQHSNEDVRDAAIATIEAINNPQAVKPKK